jgi:hypothetical protein
MKAEELRIGNWIRYAGKEIELTRQKFKLCVFTLGLDELHEPIPLTEEWLMIKSGYGLVSIESNLWISQKEDGIFYLTDDKDDFISNNPIKYVHQLQNLYFALTGTELTIK